MIASVCSADGGFGSSRTCFGNFTRGITGGVRARGRRGDAAFSRRGGIGDDERGGLQEQEAEREDNSVDDAVLDGGLLVLGPFRCRDRGS